MDWKAFLRPDVKRVVIFAVLVLLEYLFPFMMPGSTVFGFPFPAVIIGFGMWGVPSYNVWWPSLIADVVVLYLVACLIAFKIS